MKARLVELETRLQTMLTDEGFTTVDEFRQKLDEAQQSLKELREAGKEENKPAKRLREILVGFQLISDLIQEIEILQLSLQETTDPFKDKEAEIYQAMAEEGIDSVEQLNKQYDDKISRLSQLQKDGRGETRPAQRLADEIKSLLEIKQLVAALDQQKKDVETGEQTDIQVPPPFDVPAIDSLTWHLPENMLEIQPESTPNEQSTAVIDNSKLQTIQMAQEPEERLIIENPADLNCQEECTSNVGNSEEKSPTDDASDDEDSSNEARSLINSSSASSTEDSEFNIEEVIPEEDYFLALHDLNTKLGDLIQQKEIPSILFNAQHVLKEMPDCAEKTLALLFIHFEVAKLSVAKKDRISLLDPDKLNAIFLLLQKQLQEEQLLDSLLQAKLGLIRPLLSEVVKDKEIADVLYQIKKHIQSIDAAVLLQYINNTLISADKIRDKNIILFLGETGSGKSTTIHFLCGSSFEREQKAGRLHFAPTKIKLPELASFSTSASTVSETTYINAIRFQGSIVGAEVADEVVLCDSPGFGDTRGPEVDIANAIGIVRGIVGCKSVKPVCLISSEIGSRAQALPKLVKILTMFIPSIEDHLSAFSYVFTKPNADINMPALLDSLLTDLQTNRDADLSDKAAIALLQDMIQKAKTDFIEIDLSRDKPGSVLDKLYASKAITDPKEVFRDFVPQESRDRLRDQLNKHKQSIDKALQSVNIPLLVYKVSQLAGIQENLRVHDSQKMYERSLEGIKELILLLQERVIQRMQLCLDEANSHIQLDMKLYAEDLYSLYQLETVRGEYLKDISDLKAFCTLKINQAQKELMANIDRHNSRIKGDILLNQLALDKMKLMVTIFHQRFQGKQAASFLEELQRIYQKATDTIKDKLDCLTVEIEESLSLNRFECLVENLDSLEQMQIAYAEHLKPVESASYIELCDKVRAALTQITSDLNITLLSSPVHLDTTKVKTLFSTIHLINYSLYGIDKHLGKAFLEDKMKVAEELIKGFFTKAKDQLLPGSVENLSKQNIEFLHSMILNMDKLREIEALNSITSTSYHAVVDTIRSAIHNLSKDAEHALDLLLQVKSGMNLQINVSTITKAFECLSAATIFEGHPSAIYQDELILLSNRLSLFVDRVNEALTSYAHSDPAQAPLLEALLVVKYLKPLLSTIVLYCNDASKIQASYEQFITKIESEFTSIEKYLDANGLIFEDGNRLIRTVQWLEITANYLFQLYPQRLEAFTTQLQHAAAVHFSQTENKLEVLYQSLLKGGHAIEEAAINLLVDSLIRAQTFSTEFQNDAKLATEEKTDQYNTALSLVSAVKTLLFQNQPRQMLQNWASEGSGKLLTHIDRLLAMIEPIQSSMLSFEEACQAIHMASNLKRLDKILPAEKNYSTTQISLESALRTQTLSQMNELRFLIHSQEVDAFVRLYQEILKTNPDLKAELQAVMSLMTASLAEQMDHISKRMLGFKVDERCAELILQLSSLAQAHQLFQDAYPELVDATKLGELPVLEQQIKVQLETFVKGCLIVLQENKFSLVEQNLTILNRIIQDLAVEASSPRTSEYIQRIEGQKTELTGALEERLKEQSGYYVQLPIEQFPDSPPVLFLNQLAAAVEEGKPYAAKRKDLTEHLGKKILDCIVRASSVDASPEDIKQFKLIEHLSDFLTLDVVQVYRERLIEVRKIIEEKDNQLIRIISEQAVAGELRKLVDDLSAYISRSDFRSAHLVSEAIKKLIHEVATRFKSDLEKGDIATVIQALPISWEDWWYYADQLNQVASSLAAPYNSAFSPNYVNDIINDMVKRITQKYAELFVFIEKQSKLPDLGFYKRIPRAFEQIMALIDLTNVYQEFKKTNPTLPHFYEDLVKELPQLGTDTVQVLEAMISYLVDRQDQVLSALKTNEASLAVDILTAVQTQQEFIEKLENFSEHRMIKVSYPLLSEAFSKVQPYNELKKQLTATLIDWKTSVDITLLHNAALKHQDSTKLETFYEQVASSCEHLHAAKMVAPHVDESITNFKTIEKEMKEHLLQELEKIGQELLSLISRLPTDDEEIFSSLYIWRTNLLVIKKTFDKPGLTIFSQQAEHLLRLVERAFEDKLKAIRESITAIKDIDELCQHLARMKWMTIGSPYLDKINKEIDATLLSISKEPDGGKKVATLGLALRHLEGELQDPAIRLINEHTAFKNVATYLRNQKTLRYTSEDVLRDLTGDQIDSAKLLKAMKQYEVLYWELVEKGLPKIKEVKREIIEKVKEIHKESGSKSDKMISITAHLFAYWTLDNSSNYMDMLDVSETSGVVADRKTEKDYLLQPHPAQVISIFRLLGIDVSGEMVLKNHLAEIGTGEGKSITLALTAMLLAFQGYTVDCACYSDYLSRRDFDAFRSLFEAFELMPYIRYGTFNQLSELMINQYGDVRDLILSTISGGQSSLAKTKSSDRPKVLLCDEVDVFFQKEFYGSEYRPLAELTDKTLIALLEYLWKNKSNKAALNVEKVKESTEYLSCRNTWKGWEFLLDESIKDMLSGLHTFEGHEYTVSSSGQIGYKEQDGISYNVNFGYKTVFAYFKEHDAGKVTRQARDDHAAMIIDCGLYSFAEVPKSYHYILGVTGTLKTLCAAEKEILKSYQIEKSSYMPSVYGSHQVEFAGDNTRDLKIATTAEYHLEIAKEIQQRLKSKTGGVSRAILVFFEDKAGLGQFYESGAAKALGFRDKIKILTEEVNGSDKEGFIAQATTPGTVTLLTREFGRGTDFKCYDDRLNLSGGVHVLQTFLSPSYSEERQIKGRTARQGNIGSYSLVLLDSDMEQFNISRAELEAIRTSGTLYEPLNKKRLAYFEALFPESLRQVERIREQHQRSFDFIEKALVPHDIPAIKAFLQARNSFRGYSKGGDTSKKARVLCLMDATGSMGSLLTQAKNTVSDMFDRAYTVLEKEGLPGAVELMFAVYRDYDQREEMLLQHSGWESKPENLKQFMGGIHAEGGDTWEEAVEIGLWFANECADKGGLDQVILIGDAPANTEALITEMRSRHHGETYWQQTKFSSPTTTDKEAAKLKHKQIPVHAYYLADGLMDGMIDLCSGGSDLKSCFERIARDTEGETGRLDIHSSMGAETLTQIVTERILKQLGGTRAVECYRELYVKGYTRVSDKPMSLFGGQGQGKQNQQPLSQNPNNPLANNSQGR